MSKTFHLTIAKVTENLFDGEAVSVSLPGADGQFEVLAGHEAFVTTLREGTAKVMTESGESLEIAIDKGIAEVSHNQATVLL